VVVNTCPGWAGQLAPTRQHRGVASRLRTRRVTTAVPTPTEKLPRLATTRQPGGVSLHCRIDSSARRAGLALRKSHWWYRHYHRTGTAFSPVLNFLDAVHIYNYGYKQYKINCIVDNILSYSIVYSNSNSNKVAQLGHCWQQ
jgi:hypothetical protein